MLSSDTGETLQQACVCAKLVCEVRLINPGKRKEFLLFTDVKQAPAVMEKLPDLQFGTELFKRDVM